MVDRLPVRSYWSHATLSQYRSIMTDSSTNPRRKRQFALLIGVAGLVLGTTAVLSHTLPLVIVGVVILLGAASMVIASVIGLGRGGKPLR
jgi:hypothetical protein